MIIYLNAMTSTSRFPHDRVVFFSDAVFAIAITLLVIEIKVPSHEEIHERHISGALYHILPLFIGYFVSFIVTSLFWKVHLEAGQLIKSFDAKMIWLNTILLLFVGLMPFTTALYSENFADNEAYSYYCVNLAAIGLMSFLIISYARKKEHLDKSLGKWHAQWLVVRTFVVPVVFLFCILLTLWSPLMSRWAFLLIFIFQIIGRSIYRKKAKASGHPF